MNRARARAHTRTSLGAGTTGALVALVAGALFLAGPSRPASAGPPRPVEYQPPVHAPVADPFRPPATPYGPGNRGIEYATDPGERVGSAAAGVVTFAGQVGGRRYVTVLHDDGVRTTYGPLASVAVASGGEVAAGESLGTAGRLLLWTARVGTAYVDPAVLLAASGFTSVHLVPDRNDTDAPGRRGGRRPVPATAARWALGRALE